MSADRWSTLWENPPRLEASTGIADDAGIDREELRGALADAWYSYQAGLYPAAPGSREDDDLENVADLLDQVLVLLNNPLNLIRISDAAREAWRGSGTEEPKRDELIAYLARTAAAARKAHRPRGGGQPRDEALRWLVHHLAEFWRRRKDKFTCGELVAGVPKGKGGEFVWKCVKLIDPQHGRGLTNAIRDEADPPKQE
jgi:hypothetical protein